MDALQFYSAMGGIIAALIAGFLSLLSLVTSKDQKLSELRHQFISEFRKEIAELVSEFRYSAFWVEEFAKDTSNQGKNPYMAESYRASYLCMSKCINALMLRIDPAVANDELRGLNSKLLADFETFRGRFGQFKPEDVEDLASRLRDDARPILQWEWRRIERGELGHRVLKAVATIILALGLTGVLWVGMSVPRGPTLGANAATPSPAMVPPSK